MTDPRQPDTGRGRWRFWLAVSLAIIAAASLLMWRSRLRADFLPPDRSFVGPNLLASIVQAAFLTIVAVLLYPPWRRAAHRFLDAKLDAVHVRLDAHHAERLRQADEHHAEQMAAHEVQAVALTEHRLQMDRHLKRLHEKHDRLTEALIGRQERPPEQ